MNKKLASFKEEKLLDEFYQYFLNFGNVQKITPDPNCLDLLKNAQTTYFINATKEEYDLNYVLEKLQAILSHYHMGISVNCYIAIYQKYLTLLLSHLASLPEIDSQTLTQDFDLISKIILFDLGLAIDAYTHEKTQTIENHLDDIIQGIDGIIWEFNVLSHQYVHISHKSEAMLGYNQKKWIEDPEFHNTIIHSDDRDHSIATFNHAIAGKNQDIEYRIITENGQIVWVNERITVIKNKKGEVISLRGLILNIEKHKIYEEQLAYMAAYDELTELPNRSSFNDRLKDAIAYAKRSGYYLAVMFIDLDSFKYVNDSFGHSVGDKLLQTIAQRLKNTLREHEFAARFGGDEFCIILDNINDTISATHIAHRCLKILERPTFIDDHEIFPRASIGISLYPQDGKTPEVLLQCADNAMYSAKSAGKHQFAFYNKEMTILAQQRLNLEKDLRLALKREEFELYYQPQIDLSTGKLLAVEALIRWHHPEQGMISPDMFIPIAENIGMIVPLGIWVLNQACKQMAEWRKSSVSVNYIAINISSTHFCDATLPSDILLALANTGIQACDIELEITESVMQTEKEGIAYFQAIKDLGIKIAIDDFGTGYSCLASLTELPIDSLKIDKAFIQRVLSDNNKATIVATIIAMSRALGLSVVAEGAETIEQITYLQGIGCDTVQGYYFSKPVPANQIPKLATTNFLNCKK